MTEPGVGIGYLFGLFGVIVSGAVLPVVPTGAGASVAAALAERDELALIELVVTVVTVVTVGAAGAWVADLATYAVLRVAGARMADEGGRLGRWLHRQRRGRALDQVAHQIREHEMRTLVFSRLVPGGQIPVLLAAAMTGYPWRRYAVADIAAATLWSIMYSAGGLLGRAIFAEPWEGAAAGIVGVLVAGVLSRMRTRQRARRADATPCAGAPPPSTTIEA